MPTLKWNPATNEHDHNTRLSAIVPPPRRHVTLYFGVLSSHSKWRNKGVPKANEEVEGSTAQNGSGEPIPAPVVETEIKSGTGPLSRYLPWHELLRRTFGSEIVCPDCGGKFTPTPG